MTRRTDSASSAPGIDDAVIGPYDPLTTKEGWPRFVDHQPAPPELHSAAVLQQMLECQPQRFETQTQTRATSRQLPDCWASSAAR